MTRKQRYKSILDFFEKNNPDAETELLYDNPFQLLVSVILSAQCTDKRVNLTTPAIFAKYPDAHRMAKATVDELKTHPYLRYNIANAIVQYRIQHGSFSSVSDIKKIMMITDEIYNKAAPYLTVK